jgi:ABC-type dipeptide/oligopeptide/nickel transport system permease subunit
MTTTLVSRERRLRLPQFIVGDWGGRIGGVLLLFVIVVSVVGPAVAPYGGNVTIGIPGQGPTASYPLGLDFLGRDVLSRTLDGGSSTVLLGVVATVLTYLIGITFGLIAGYSRSLVDSFIMRAIDLLISFPALLVMLLFVTAFGGTAAILILAVVLVLFPGVVRIVRTATMEISTRSYVEAAVARGERTGHVLRREILPNIAAPIIADVGIRFAWAIILIASVNYLGLGLQPPSANWGLMISENQEIISTNPLALFAPAAMLGILVVGVNLVGDAFARHLGRSGTSR